MPKESVTFRLFPHNFVNNHAQSIELPQAKSWTKHSAFKGLLGLRANYLMYDHPTVRKVAEIAAYTLGCALVIGACMTPPIAIAIGLGATGALVLGITHFAARVLNILVPMRHDMKKHAYHPEKLEKNGILLGELYYEKDVPILRIESTDPYEAGYTYGCLLGKKIAEIRHNIDFCLHTLMRCAKPAQLSVFLQSMKSKIPQQYLTELAGVVDGYNAKKSKFEKVLTLDELLFLQLMPDLGLIPPNSMLAMQTGQKPEKQALPLQIAACSLSAIFDDTNRPLIARTMDWSSFGNMGKLSLIVSRINASTGILTAEVAVPGLLGTVTGINNQGVCVAMNVAPYASKIDSIEGLPSAFYNRLLLESCTSFAEAKTFVASNKALGPYHLTVSDKTTAGTFSMYQQQDYANDWNLDKHNGHQLRLLEDQSPLITTNCSCTPNVIDQFDGKLRQAALNNYLAATKGIDDRKKVLKHSQVIPYVNNQATTHRVIMGPNTLEVAFDNAWAGDRELYNIDLSKLFS